MTSAKQTARDARAVGRAIALAGANSIAGSEMLMAAGEVIGKRMALGAAAIADPVNADHEEFALMIPEKARAFGAAGTILIERSARAAQYASAVAMKELALAAKATTEIAGCATPAALAVAQGDFAWSWFGPQHVVRNHDGHHGDAGPGRSDGPGARVAAMANARRLRR